MPTWQQLHAGPFGPHLGLVDDLIEQRLARGFTRSTVVSQVRCLAQFGEWLSGCGRNIDTISSRSIEDFRANIRRLGQGRRLVGLARDFLETLRARGIVVPEPEPPTTQTAVQSAVAAFGDFLIRGRALSAATRTNYLPFVLSFLSERFAPNAVRLADLTARDVTDFIRRHARDHGHGRAQLMVTALRCFLRYLLLEGMIEIDLSTSVPPVADWRLQHLPKALPADEVEQLLRHCNLENPAGPRDKAILLLLARLGLRAGDIVHLELEDLDWESGTVALSGKSRRLHRLPLPHDAGEALAHYLRYSRPVDAPTRRVFVRVRPPFQGFRSSVAVSSLVHRALRRAGLSPARKGAPSVFG